MYAISLRDGGVSLVHCGASSGRHSARRGQSFTRTGTSFEIRDQFGVKRHQHAIRVLSCDPGPPASAEHATDRAAQKMVHARQAARHVSSNTTTPPYLLAWMLIAHCLTVRCRQSRSRPQMLFGQ